MVGIKDVHEGKFLQIWEDGDSVFISFLYNGCTVNIPKDSWLAIVSEIVESSKEAI